MKKLNLDETWTLCLKMWKWIAKKRRESSYKLSVYRLKEEWLTKHGFDPDTVMDTCFFCEYRIARKDTDECYLCPAVKVNPDFRCSNSSYHYAYKPIAFYKKLAELNKIRLSRKKK